MTTILDEIAILLKQINRLSATHQAGENSALINEISKAGIEKILKEQKNIFVNVEDFED